jgi:hypothetical protein
MQPFIEDIFPLAPFQDFILYFVGLIPGGLSYQQQYTYYLHGQMPPERCRDAWSRVIEAHPGLRSSFHRDNISRGYQVIHRVAEPNFHYEDLRQMSPEERERYVFGFIERDFHTPLNHYKPPVLRITLKQIEDDLSIMTLTLSHVIFDGWSLGVALTDFAQVCAELTRGGNGRLEKRPSIRPYLAWFNNREKGDDLAWWREQLRGATLPRLPFLPPEVKAVMPATANKIHHLILTEEETRVLEKEAASMSITLNILFQAVWGLMIARLSPERRAVMLTVAASRPPEVKSIDKIFGLLLDALPYHLNCPDDQRVSLWLQSLHELQMEAMERRFVPIQDLVAMTDDGTHIPIYNSYLVFENMDAGEGKKENADLEIQGAYMNSNVGLPVCMMVLPAKQLRVALIYSEEYYSAETAELLSKALYEAMFSLAQNRDLTLAEAGDLAQLPKVEAIVNQVAQPALVNEAAI